MFFCAGTCFSAGAVSWHDARNDPGNVRTEFYATASADGGENFASSFPLSGGQSRGLSQGKFSYGDYSGLAFQNRVFFPVWADNSSSDGTNPDYNGVRPVNDEDSKFTPRRPFPFIRGDANGDMVLDISDGSIILNWLFTGLQAPCCMDAADADDDNAISITDGIRVLSYLFSGGPPPAGPFPDPGFDPTLDDDFSCIYVAYPN